MDLTFFLLLCYIRLCSEMYMTSIHLRGLILKPCVSITTHKYEFEIISFALLEMFNEIYNVGD